MTEKLTTLEMIARIAERSGLSKKISNDLIRVLPDIIEAGLERDGEVRIPGLGTFRLKWVETRIARNLKTGAEVEVPAHSKVVFLPEKALKEQVNGDFRLLTYQVLDKGPAAEIHEPGPEPSPKPEITEPSDSDTPEPKEAVDLVKEVIRQSELEIRKAEAAGDTGTAGAEYPYPWMTEQPGEDNGEEPPVGRNRKMIYWIIPLLFLIIALLVVVFYMKNCRTPVAFPGKDKPPSGQVTPQVQPPADTAFSEPADTVTPADQSLPEVQKPDTMVVVPPVEEPAPQGFAQMQFQVTGGKHLFQVARETYGNPYLWSLIYKENIDKITDPEQVLSGITLIIPSLEGTPDRLSRSDSVRVAGGYSLLYEYYLTRNEERAKEFKWAVNRFSPE